MPSNNQKKPELLSPAGSTDKMAAAFSYGADAAYIGTKNFSLREGASNFTLDEYRQSIESAHKNKKKIYLAANIIFHDKHFNEFRDFMKEIATLPPDGIICSDLGAISYTREKYPEIPLHISTQANTTNSESVKFYKKIGASRIILARELNIDEIKAIRDSTDLEIETFVHGAMCISYSGRCLMSNYFTNQSIRRNGERASSQKKEGTRDANLGDCSQSCRWEYFLVEKTRKNDMLPIEETAQGTSILSSKDLNLSAHMKELISAGIDSFKIEGRMKSLYYTSLVTKVYRNAIDNAIKGIEPDLKILSELEKVSHREYTTGFYFSENKALLPVTNPGYIKGCLFLGYVTEITEPGKAWARSMNRILAGEPIEVISPESPDFILEKYKLFIDGIETSVVQANTEFNIEFDASLIAGKWSILRKLSL